jgi:hypothetical protein
MRNSARVANHANQLASTTTPSIETDPGEYIEMRRGGEMWSGE